MQAIINHLASLDTRSIYGATRALECNDRRLSLKLKRRRGTKSTSAKKGEVDGMGWIFSAAKKSASEGERIQ